MDVDSLGQIFSRGLRRMKGGNEVSYQSFSRVASLSRELDLFFKFHLSRTLACKPIDGFESFKLIGDAKAREAVIVYAGGDDLFIVGAWSDIIGTAFDIHRSLKLYTGENPNLDILGGVTAFQTKYPLYKMAEEVGELEESAKRHRQDGKEGEEKKAISLFRSGLIFKWNDPEEMYIGELRLLIYSCKYKNGRVRFKLP